LTGDITIGKYPFGHNFDHTRIQFDIICLITCFERQKSIEKTQFHSPKAWRWSEKLQDPKPTEG
jgi:hypothetical protein